MISVLFVPVFLISQAYAQSQVCTTCYTDFDKILNSCLSPAPKEGDVSKSIQGLDCACTAQKTLDDCIIKAPRCNNSLVVPNLHSSCMNLPCQKDLFTCADNILFKPCKFNLSLTTYSKSSLDCACPNYSAFDDCRKKITTCKTGMMNQLDPFVNDFTNQCKNSSKQANGGVQSVSLSLLIPLYLASVFIF